MANAGIHHLSMSNTVHTIQYAENKTQIEIKYIQLQPCLKVKRENEVWQ